MIKYRNFQAQPVTHDFRASNQIFYNNFYYLNNRYLGIFCFTKFTRSVMGPKISPTRYQGTRTIVFYLPRFVFHAVYHITGLFVHGRDSNN